MSFKMAQETKPDVIGEFLKAISPEELEAEVLSMASWGSNYTYDLLATLIKRAEGWRD